MSEIAKIEDERRARRFALLEAAQKAVRKKYPSYDAAQLRAGLGQLRKNIAVIEQQLAAERKSMAEFEALIPVCEKRDRELAELSDG